MRLKASTPHFDSHCCISSHVASACSVHIHHRINLVYCWSKHNQVKIRPSYAKHFLIGNKYICTIVTLKLWSMHRFCLYQLITYHNNFENNRLYENHQSLTCIILDTSVPTEMVSLILKVVAAVSVICSNISTAIIKW